VSNELNIDFKWLGRSTGSPLERAFFADIGIAAGDDWLTLLEDQQASTVRTHLRGCAYHLARWFAANWWRLRWEPETRGWMKDPDWRIAHSMAAAGGGYVWPNLLFASAGDFLTLASRPRTKPAPFEPIRYLNRIDTTVDAAEFERKVDGFISSVLSRLDSLGIEDATLPELWREVLEERSDPDTCQRRKFEAMAGYDPDQAPDALLMQLLEDPADLGQGALEEVAAEAQHETLAVLAPIVRLARPGSAPLKGGVRGSLPNLDGKPSSRRGERPWQQATRLARAARTAWGLGDKPVDNATLGDLLGVDASIFSEHTQSAATLPLALRTKASSKVDLYFNSAWPTSRRFSTGRMIGDHLGFSAPGRLIPATDAKTSRQQFQRAFAQEFLCPIDALRNKIQTDQPKDEDIAEAAAYFDVSPLMVRTTLVNNGELDRDALARPW